jgi:hypothetical protein
MIRRRQIESWSFEWQPDDDMMEKEEYDGAFATTTTGGTGDEINIVQGPATGGLTAKAGL